MRVQLAFVALALVAFEGLQAKPYYYFFQDAPEPTAPEAGAAQVTNADALKEAAEKAGQQVANAASTARQEAGQGASIRGHLSDLYTHGSSAMRGVVDTVQPDIKNIGKDLSEAYQATRTQVGKTIEPLAQTVRPYIDQAQKMVAPYVSQAREEVPKLINQAGPTLHKVGEQVRGKLSGVIDKLRPANGGSGLQAAGQQMMASGQEHVQSAASSVQQAGQEAQASVQNAAQQAQQQVQAASS